VCMMGKLICTKCKATAEASTFEKADELIDHARGVLRGKPCQANPLNLLWNGKPVATIVFHYGPGSKDHKRSQEESDEKDKADAEAEKKAIAAKKKADKDKSENDQDSPQDPRESSSTK